MAFMSEQIPASILRSLCQDHYQGFQRFHLHMPSLKESLDELYFKDPHSLVFSKQDEVFPPYPFFVTKMQWKRLHVWVTAKNADMRFSHFFHEWAIYGINCINHCAVCNAFFDVDLYRAVEIRAEMLFQASIATRDRAIILKTASQYPLPSDRNFPEELREADRRIESLEEQIWTLKEDKRSMKRQVKRLRHEITRQRWALQEKETKIQILAARLGHPTIQEVEMGVELSDAASNMMWESDDDEAVKNHE